MEKIEDLAGLAEEQEREIAWTREEINNVPSGRWLYRIVCFLMGRKRLTYREMFLVLYGMHVKRMGADKAKKSAAQRIISIYEYNNNKLPEGIEHERA